MRSKKQSELTKHHVSKHLPPLPVWFHQEPLDPADGWVETPTAGKKIIGIRSVLYSDGSARRWYRMAVAVKKKLKQKKNSKREKRVSKK
jgi:hypothetical protein